MPSSASSSTTERVASKREGTSSAPEHEPDPRPTIVFLHGTVLSGAAWATQIAALGDAFHCLAPDLPGHGTSADTPFTIDRAAEDVAELIVREAHDGRAIVVGLSLGGYVAMTVAERWPERVAGLVVSGASAEPVGVASLGFRLFASALDIVPDGVLEVIYRRFFRVRFPAVTAEPIITAGFRFRGGVVALRALVGQRFKPRLAAYPGPSLLLNGELDLFFRPGERSFAAVAADARRRTIRRATHLANLDRPEAFSAVIRDFATRISRPTG